MEGYRPGWFHFLATGEALPELAGDVDGRPELGSRAIVLAILRMGRPDHLHLPLAGLSMVFLYEARGLSKLSVRRPYFRMWKLHYNAHHQYPCSTALKYMKSTTPFPDGAN